MSDGSGDESPTQWEARKARLVDEGVQATLVKLGFDPDEPFEIQKDMAYVRRMRLAQESITAKAIATLVGALVTGAIAALIVGIRDYLTR